MNYITLTLVSLVVTVSLAGVPHNVPCLTGASVQGTTAKPCSGGKTRFSSNQFLACGGKSLSVYEGERTRFVWWQFWNLSFRNSLSSVSIRAGCTLIGYTENDWTGRSLILRAVGSQRHVDLIDAEYNSFNNDLESYECRC